MCFLAVVMSGLRCLGSSVVLGSLTIFDCDGVFVGVAEVDRLAVVRVHQLIEAVDEVVDELEAPRLRPVAVEPGASKKRVTWCPTFLLKSSSRRSLPFWDERSSRGEIFFETRATRVRLPGGTFK